MAITFDPAHTGASLVLSAANLGLRLAGGVQNCSRLTVPFNFASGKKAYLEYTRTANDTTNFPSVGFALASDDAGVPFTGAGTVGWVMSPNGWSFSDNDSGTTVKTHSAANTSVVVGAHINANVPAHTLTIGVELDGTAGSMSVYLVDYNGVSTSKTLAYTITGMSGIGYPTLGSGGGTPSTEAYLLNVGGSAFQTALAAGFKSYKDVVSPSNSHFFSFL